MFQLINNHCVMFADNKYVGGDVLILIYILLYDILSLYRFKCKTELCGCSETLSIRLTFSGSVLVTVWMICAHFKNH